MPKASHEYGGKFGVQQDRMDKSAVGHEYQSKLSKHCSQTDTSKGFGGNPKPPKNYASKHHAELEQNKCYQKHCSKY
ncbi:hypothetical protein NQD34_000859 [Periophthalmus magnuspinnatus]|nr:hypothetical protein NQD34_000859 [Periophthalmus magnuspinnatus]